MHLGFLGDRLGGVEDPLDLLRAAGDVGVERQRPVDLDDVDGDELGLGVPGLVGDEPDDPGVARAAVEGDDRSPEGRGCGSLTWAAVTIPPVPPDYSRVGRLGRVRRAVIAVRSAGVERASPVLAPVRDVDDDGVRPAEQHRPQPLGRLVVQDPLPPACGRRTRG